jgi:tetratricopeptide (TPR) repeat protein
MRTPGHEAEAEQLYREALGVRRRALGDGDAETADTAFRLAQVLGNQGRLDEAEALLREAHASLAANQASGPAREYEPVMRRWIVEQYQSWKKSDKAAEWERRLPPTELDKHKPKLEKK